MFSLFERVKVAARPAAQGVAKVAKNVTYMTVMGMGMHASGTAFAHADMAARKKLQEFKAQHLKDDSAPSNSITLT